MADLALFKYVLQVDTSINNINQNASGQSAAPAKGPKLERPKIDAGISMEQWNTFQRRWTLFRNGYKIKDAEAAEQLFDEVAAGHISAKSGKESAVRD